MQLFTNKFALQCRNSCEINKNNGSVLLVVGEWNGQRKTSARPKITEARSQREERWRWRRRVSGSKVENPSLSRKKQLFGFSCLLLYLISMKTVGGWVLEVQRQQGCHLLRRCCVVVVFIAILASLLETRNGREREGEQEKERARAFRTERERERKRERTHRIRIN